MVLQNFIFLDATSTSTTSNTLINSGGKCLTLEVSPVTEDAAVAVAFQGKIDSNSDTFYDLTARYGATGNYSASATAAGIYYLDVTGIPSIQVVSTGTAGDTIVIGRLSV